MIKTFFREESIVGAQSKFGKFYYDVNISRELPEKYYFDRDIARESLVFIHEVFEEQGLRFFLIFGTALGIIREKDFLLHDVDIDLGIFYKDKSKLIFAIKKLIKKYGFKVLKISSKEESVTLVYKKIVIDIGLFQKKGTLYIYNDFYENKIPAKMLESLEKVSFSGKDFYLPSPSHKYLIYQYGTRWREPVVDWNYINKYISKDQFHILRKYKQLIKKSVKKILNKTNMIKHRFTWLNSFLKDIGITKVQSIEQFGQGFCDTFIIKAEKNIVVKKNNKSRFNSFKQSYLNHEPIYRFIEYSKRFKYEKNIFEKINNKEVTIRDNIIVFPYIDSRPLSSYLYDKKFFIYLKKAFEMLKNNNIRHGDLHIENILVSNNEVYLIDFEMIFSDYLTIEEQYYYDIYFFFAKLKYQYPEFFNDNYINIKEFIQSNFTNNDLVNIIRVANKTKQYFFNVNGAKVDLFEI